jgi:hypothetical protein
MTKLIGSTKTSVSLNVTGIRVSDPDPYSIGPVDPDPDPYSESVFGIRIRIRIQEGKNDPQK